MIAGLIDRLNAPGVLRVAQIATGLVFLAAGLSKLGDLPSFALQVHNYRVLPVWSEHLVAMTIPWIELVAGLALVLGVRPRAGALVATGLLGVFTLAVAAAWARGLDFECGCFGKASASRIGLAKLVENATYLAFAAVALLPPRRR